MGTDRYAYASRLRRVDAIPKLWLSLIPLLLCVCCDSAAVGVATLLLMGGLNVWLGGQRLRTVLRFLKVPLAFLALGCLTILVRPLSPEEGALWAVELLGRFRWGITAEYRDLSLMVLCKAMGAVSAMYFLSLNTPVTDVTLTLERLRVPKLLVELMELIYRFIFVLTDTAGRIRVAQESRLGYQGWRRSLESMGTLVSMLFLRAWRQGERSFTALESRGYKGRLDTLPADAVPGKWLYAVLAGVSAAQLGALALERSLLG